MYYPIAFVFRFTSASVAIGNPGKFILGPLRVLQKPSLKTQPEGYNSFVPTILNINGFRFIIWPADHEPPHVHVFKGKGEVKINIGNDDEAPRLKEIYGLTKQEMRQAWDLVAEHQEIFIDSMEAHSS